MLCVAHHTKRFIQICTSQTSYLSSSFLLEPLLLRQLLVVFDGLVLQERPGIRLTKNKIKNVKNIDC
jgi:hypothetical protein